MDFTIRELIKDSIYDAVDLAHSLNLEEDLETEATTASVGKAIRQ